MEVDFPFGAYVKRDIRLAVLLLFVVCFSLALLTVWKVWSSRERALNEVNFHSLNLTQALDTYAEGIINQSSMLLLGLVERLEIDGSGPQQIARLRALVSNQQYLLSQLSGITIYNQAGDWLMSSNRPVKVGANSSDRAFFIHHRENPSREIFIGLPIRSRSTHEWVITVSRRFDHSDGRFAGVVAVTLGIENFLNVFGKLDLGQEGAIGLSYADGQLLVRYPFREQDMGRNFSTSPIYTRYLVDRSVGTASFASSLDGVERLYAFRKNEHLPLVTTVAMGKNEALATWRMEACLSAGVVLTLLFVIGGIGLRLIRDINRRAEAEAQLVIAREALLQTNERLELLASMDQLTGLANRRRFEEVLGTEVKRANRERTPLSLLLIDIDYFKLFNDTYGHVAGDEGLRVVSRVLRQCVKRPSDLAARYGGEELAVILPNTTEAGAVAVAERVLERLSHSNIAHRSSPYGRLTVSIGVAVMPVAQVQDAALALVEAADQALYEAKAEGRNRVAVYLALQQEQQPPGCQA